MYQYLQSGNLNSTTFHTVPMTCRECGPVVRTVIWTASIADDSGIENKNL